MGEGSSGLFHGSPFQTNDSRPLFFEFKRMSEKNKAFDEWVQEQIDKGILERPDDETNADKLWTTEPLFSAYKKGVLRGYLDVHKKDLAEKFGVGALTQEEFLAQAFINPVYMNRVNLLFTRAYEDLKNITRDMANQMSRTMARGMADGLGLNVIARNLRRDVDNIGWRRSILFARTEVMSAHAEGQLDSFESFGNIGVSVEAEILTAGDERVCERCSLIAFVVLSIEEARGLLPLHVCCRCIWIPSNIGEEQTSQKRGPARENALRQALGSEKYEYHFKK